MKTRGKVNFFWSKIATKKIMILKHVELKYKNHRVFTEQGVIMLEKNVRRIRMENLIINEKNIKNKIYEIRNKQVMLDSDLAKLYGVETKRINEAVKNNPEKFPERFSWILSDNEWNFLRSKFSTLKTLKNGRGSHRKYLPRVFTEQGVAMLATILKSDVAIKVSIAIMDAFVLMRKYISNELIEQKFINKQVLKNTEDIKLLQESFNKLEDKEVIDALINKIKI